MNKFKSLPVLLVNQKILLIGGGKVAFGKAKVLKENNIDFDIVSLSIADEIKKLGVPIKQKIFERTDLKDYNIVVDATGSEEVRDLILEEKKQRFLLVNFVDIPQYCDFYFSALLQYKNLKIAVSSDGGSPTLAQFVRDKIKRVIPTELGDLAEKKFEERKEGIVDISRTKDEIIKASSKIYIVGCGTGDPELLTIKALRIIKNVDVILYDHLISDEILALIPDGTERVYVGKPKGSQNNEQNKINNMLLKYTSEGLQVARLKSGDPFVFGRGAEEAEFIIMHGYSVEIVPGISSALAAPLCAGIPVTARGIASGFSIVTGCLKGNKTNYEWLDLLKKENHTTVLLMGLSYIEEIVEQAILNGVDKNLPAAIISNATRDNQQVFVASLEELPLISKNASGPSVIVFGNVVQFQNILPRYISGNTKELYYNAIGV